MKESIAAMSRRISSGISKKSASYVEECWLAIQRVEQGDGETVTMKAADHAFVYGYLKACAKKAGLL